MLGKGFGYRVNTKAPTSEQREQAAAELVDARAERDKLKAARDARYSAILKADEEYQTLHAKAKAASDRCEHLSGLTRWYKITVGKSNGIFFHVMAEGDSWEEVIPKAAAYKQKHSIA